MSLLVPVLALALSQVPYPTSHTPLPEDQLAQEVWIPNAKRLASGGQWSAFGGAAAGMALGVGSYFALGGQLRSHSTGFNGTDLFVLGALGSGTAAVGALLGVSVYSAVQGIPLPWLRMAVLYTVGAVLLGGVTTLVAMMVEGGLKGAVILGTFLFTRQNLHSVPVLNPLALFLSGGFGLAVGTYAASNRFVDQVSRFPGTPLSLRFEF